MKQIILFCLVLILSVVTCQNVQTVTIDSDELGRSIQAQIYLPPNYSTSRGPYPVMIFLHGTELDHDDYPEVINVVEEFVNGNDFPAMIVVKPNGNWQAPTPTDIWDCSSMPSWWINNDIFGNYEDFLSNELIDWLDERYDINRDYIALAGHSAGGFGAFYNGFKNPQVFSAVLSFSGVVFIDEIANDMLVTNDKWWLEYDAQGIVTLADSYTDNDKTPPPTTEQSPSLGYFSDLQWKMNYVFSPRTNDEAPFAFDKDQVDNIFVGSPDPDTIQNISIDQDTKERWEEYNIDAILRANRNNVERLDFLYWDVGIFDGFNLQNDADAIADTIIDNNIALNYYYEQFNTGEGCDQCIPGTCPATSYYCGGHFADRDNLSHGSCQSRFYNGLPYTGGIGSRVRVALTALAPFWSGIEVTQSATSDGSATIVTSTTRTVSDTSLSFSEISTDTSDSSNSNSNTSNTSDSSNDSSDDSSNDSSSAIALTVAFAFIFFSVLVL